MLQPGATGRAALNDGSTPDCPAAAALPQKIGQVFELTGRLQCYQPGNSTPFGTNIAPQNTVVRKDSPQLGDFCQNIYYHPVTFSEDTTGNPRAIFADFGNASSGSTPLSADDAAMMGTHDAFMSDTQLGSYEPSNPGDPNSPLTCVLDPTYHFYCPATGVIGPPVCYTWQLHKIEGAQPLSVDVAPFFSNVLGSIQAAPGTIHSSPVQKGLVNTPVCFWIDGATVTRDRDLSLVLPGPVDSSGRQIFYTFLARLRFQGVTWHFDEASLDDSTVQSPFCPSGPFAAAHVYTRISDERHPDLRYHVTATENYSVSVQVFWWDSRGKQGPFPVDPGIASPTLSPDVYPQYVGQVEGVPIGGQ